jgi:hypothetical protein
MKFLCKLFYKKNNVLNALSFLFRSKFRTRRNSMQVQCQKKEAVAKHPVQKKNCQSNFKVNVFPAGVRDGRSVYGTRVGIHKRKRQTGRCRSTWEDTKKDFRETGWNGVDWVHLARDIDNWQALANIIMKLRVL